MSAAESENLLKRLGSPAKRWRSVMPAAALWWVRSAANALAVLSETDGDDMNAGPDKRPMLAEEGLRASLLRLHPSRGFQSSPGLSPRSERIRRTKASISM